MQVFVVPNYDPGAACAAVFARVEEAGREMALQAAEPRFAGVLNGVTFYPVNEDAEFLRMRSPRCATNPVRDAPELERASPLNFTTGYLPQGTSLTGHFVSACADDVILIASDYRGAKGPLTIYRLAGPAAHDARFSAGQLQALTISGRQAVIIEEKVVLSSHYTIVMRDEKGMWRISGMDIDRAEILRIAEGIR